MELVDFTVRALGAATGAFLGYLLLWRHTKRSIIQFIENELRRREK